MRALMRTYLMGTHQEDVESRLRFLSRVMLALVCAGAALVVLSVVMWASC